MVGAAHDDDDGANSGSAYVFRWNGSSWVEEQKLLASDAAAGDMFGYRVSVSGDVALVGAKDDDDDGYASGSAYVFRWNGSSWVEEQKLLASDAAEADQFSESVSISGDVAMVGAAVAMVGAAHDDDDGANSGSAYVFRWNGSSWVEEQKLLASDGAADDRFGGSVSVSGDVALIGASFNATGGSTGLAYVFRWNGSSWVEEQKLLASDGAAGDYFGFEVSISGDVALLGARWDDDNGNDSGSAYVYELIIPIDTDGDGIPDDEDACPNSDLSGTVIIDSWDTGVGNVLLVDGCTISDLIAECADEADNHGEFVSAVSHTTNTLKEEGIIGGKERGILQKGAANATIP
jgi:hypothetical protein